MTEEWPLSAVATKVLLTGRARPEELLPLAYKELVVRGLLVLRPGAPRRFGGPKTELCAVEGATTDHPELLLLLRFVRHVAAAGLPVEKVVAEVRRMDARIPQRIGTLAATRLVEAGLATVTERRLLGRVVRRRLSLTPTGQQARAHFQRLIGERRPSEVSPALLLLGDRRLLGSIDRALLDSSPYVSFDVGSFDSMSCFDAACHDGGGHDGGGHGGGHDGGGH